MMEYFNRNPIALRIFLVLEILLIIATITIMIGCPYMILWFFVIGFLTAILGKILDEISDTWYWIYDEEKTFIWGTVCFMGTIILYMFFYNIGKYDFWRN